MTFADELDSAAAREDGIKVAKLLSITLSDPVEHSSVTNGAMVDRDVRNKFRDVVWGEIGVAHWRVAVQVAQRQDLAEAYAAQNMLLVAANRAAERADNWILPALFTIAKELRQLAILADQTIGPTEDGVSKLEEATRTINRSFTLCLNDRNADMACNKKWGVYFFVGELVKIYFRLNKKPLAKSVVKVVHSMARDLPPLAQYPRAHQVTFLYYWGVLLFFDEDYPRAIEKLQQAWDQCHRKQRKNHELILLYLIPARLVVSGMRPKPWVWGRYPRLATLYRDVVRAADAGDIRHLDAALARRRKTLVRRYLWLPFEKVRMSAVCKLFYRVYQVLGSETRLPTHRLVHALTFSGFYDDPDTGTEPSEEDKLDHAEGLAASLIAQGKMKGYISHERRTIVLSNKDPFPVPN